jgi:hypothetical protein
MAPSRAGIFLTGLALLLAGCGLPAGALPPALPSAAPPQQPSPTAPPSAPPRPSLSATVPPAPPSATPASTATLAAGVCSPLEDIELGELGQPDLLKNTFDAPRPGLDEGHPGADFAYWSRGERKAMLGLGVRSLLAGRVAGLVQNRTPYGYAIIVETPLAGLPPGWIDRLRLPTPAPTVPPAPNLTCPAPEDATVLPAGRSLYLLYAHLNRSPTPAIGQAVACGETIGEVGTTGRSVNPHLHLETRLGPAGATFTELAHYDNGATENEMRNYCAWRVSGLYQPLDPLEVIGALSLQP